ncbi:2-oxoacid:acceptor oxidoreductase subunit alpha [Nanoarchaeota archaeon]
MTVNDLNWKIGGAAGEGIMNAGLVFAKCCMRAGLYTFSYSEYPSLIRGGHNTVDVRVRNTQLYSHTKNVNVLVALNKEAVDKHKDKISENGGIIYDGEIAPTATGEVRADVKLFNVPLKKLAEEAGSKIFMNTVAIGASLALVDIKIDHLYNILTEIFKRKGEAVVEDNKKAAKSGYEYIQDNYHEEFVHKLKEQEHKDNILISGNEAIVAGAIKAGCKFMSSYPMTPATSIMVNMVKNEYEYGIVMKHTEDELAAMNMAIGAAYTGVRAMAATSGGGFALMCEALGMASQNETPVVGILCQRAGCATGMATKTSQEDLHFALNSSPAEGPRLVLAPGDVDEFFYNTFDTFNLAEKYQLPSIIITDKFIAQASNSVKEFDTQNMKIDRGKLMRDKDCEMETDYKRYKLTEDAISPRATPGQPKCMHVASSYEHDEYGTENEESKNKIDMTHKRNKKLASLAEDLPMPQIYGKENAEFTLVGWGSMKGIVLEALMLLEKENINVNYIHFIYLNPLKKEIKELLEEQKNLILIENNSWGQLGRVIRQETGIEMKNKLLKYDGRQFFPEEIADGIKQMLKK